MSKSLTSNAIASFDAMVKHAYQDMGVLRGRVRVKTGVVGSTHRFHKMGKGLATKRIPQTDVTPMNIAHTNRTATLEDWTAPEYTDLFDQEKVDYDEKRELAGTIGKALSRREDQLIIDALEAASTTLTVAASVGGTDSGMNTAKSRRAKRLLKQQGVDRTEMATMVVSSEGMEQLLGDDSATTTDRNVVKALYDGEISRWLGLDWEQIADRDEGGLTKDGANVRTNFAFAQTSMGLAIGMNARTEVNYIAQKTSWLCNGLMSMGSIDIDALGVVEIDTQETA